MDQSDGQNRSEDEAEYEDEEVDPRIQVSARLMIYLHILIN